MENTIKIKLLPTFFHCPDTRISQNALSNVFIPLQQYISCTVTQRPQPSIRARARLQQCQQARQASAANYQAPPLMMDVPGQYGQQKHWVMPAIADTSRRATRATISHLSSGFCRGAVSSSLLYQATLGSTQQVSIPDKIPLEANNFHSNHSYKAELNAQSSDFCHLSQQGLTKASFQGTTGHAALVGITTLLIALMWVNSIVDSMTLKARSL